MAQRAATVADHRAKSADRPLGQFTGNVNPPATAGSHQCASTTANPRCNVTDVNRPKLSERTGIVSCNGPTGFYSTSLNALLSASAQNCQQLRQQGSIGVVQNIFTLYNNWLAGRFPFTARPHAPDADVDRVRELVSLLAELPPETLADQPALIRQLAAAQPLLSALVSPDGVVVRVNWRTGRNQEAGADQIVDWQLSGNQQTLTARRHQRRSALAQRR